MPEEIPHLTIRESRPTFSAWIGVVLLFAVFGLIALVLLAAMPRGDSYEQKRGAARLERLKKANEESGKSLHDYSWVDKQKGVARLPIGRAMEITVAELAQKKPAPAGPIATGAAQPGLQVTAPDVPAAAPTAPPDPKATPRATSRSGPDSMQAAQPAAAANPPDAQPGTQPGAGATPAASPGAPVDQPPVPPADRGPTPNQEAPGKPLPVRGTDPASQGQAASAAPAAPAQSPAAPPPTPQPQP